MGLSVGCKSTTSGAEVKSRFFGLATKAAKTIVIFNVFKVTRVATARVNSSETPSGVQALHSPGGKVSIFEIRIVDTC